MFDWSGVFGALGMASITVTLLIMGTFSQRMGRVTNARSLHGGFFLGSFLVGVGLFVRILNLNDDISPSAQLHDNILWIFLYNGAPALGITLGVIFAWRYWSWLLAERS